MAVFANLLLLFFLRSGRRYRDLGALQVEGILALTTLSKHTLYTQVLMLQSLLTTPPQLLPSDMREGPRLLARMSRSAARQLARAGHGSMGSMKVKAGALSAMACRSSSICNMASIALLHALTAVMMDGMSGTVAVPGTARWPVRSSTHLPLDSPRYDAMVSRESRGTAAMSTLSAILTKAPRRERGSTCLFWARTQSRGSGLFPFPYLRTFPIYFPALRDPGFFPLHHLHSFPMCRPARTRTRCALPICTTARPASAHTHALTPDGRSRKALLRISRPLEERTRPH